MDPLADIEGVRQVIVADLGVSIRDQSFELVRGFPPRGQQGFEDVVLNAGGAGIAGGERVEAFRIGQKMTHQPVPYSDAAVPV